MNFVCVVIGKFTIDHENRLAFFIWSLELRVVLIGKSGSLWGLIMKLRALN